MQATRAGSSTSPTTGAVDPVMPMVRFPQNDPNSPKCRSLAKKIDNLRKEVYEKRIPDLQNNPGQLPERIGPGEKLKDTVRGHRILLTDRLRRLKEYEERYDRECRELIACVMTPDLSAANWN